MNALFLIIPLLLGTPQDSTQIKNLDKKIALVQKDVQTVNARLEEYKITLYRLEGALLILQQQHLEETARLDSLSKPDTTKTSLRRPNN